MRESKTSPRRIEAVSKQRQAVEMRMESKTFTEIARALGYSGRTGALAAVTTALRKTLEEPCEQFRALNMERLNAIIGKFWPRMDSEEGEKAAGVVLRAIGDLRQLLGLDVRVAVHNIITGPDGEPLPAPILSMTDYLLLGNSLGEVQKRRMLQAMIDAMGPEPIAIEGKVTA